MSSRYLQPGSAWQGRNIELGLPFKWAPINPRDHVELIDCVGILVADDANRGNLSVRWHDGSETTLPFDQIHSVSQSLMQPMPMMPAFILDTGTAFASGDLIGAFLGPETEEPNRSPYALSTSLLERTVEVDQASLNGIFKVDGFDPDYDAISWTERGSWNSRFSLVTTGANAGRIDYTRSGDLVVNDGYPLNVGMQDVSGVNSLVTVRVTLVIVDS